MGLTPAHAGLLRMIAQCSGGSQQAVAAKLRMFPSRMVALIDELQERGLVERAANPEDRRTHALRLTADGHHAIDTIGNIGREHQEALLGALTKDERETLAALLGRIATEQGLTPGVHPGYARMRPASPDTDD